MVNAPGETPVTNKFSFGLTACKILLCKFNRCSIHCSQALGSMKNLGRELSFKNPYIFSKASVSKILIDRVLYFLLSDL